MASTLGFNNGHVCSFEFANLRHSGTLSLIALYDEGGTPGCNDFSVFDKGVTGVTRYDYGGNPVDNELTDILREIEGNGRSELVLRSYDATAQEYDWPVVYAWTGTGYTNVSSQYPRYYGDLLASVRKEISELKNARKALFEATPQPPAVMISHNSLAAPGSAPEPPSVMIALPREETGPRPTVAPKVEARSRHDINEELAAAAKIERFLGKKDAGMADANRWANSTDPDERKLAARVFAQMATPEAFTHEETLSRDPNHEVAKFAARRIEGWCQEDPYNAWPFERQIQRASQ